MGAQHAKGEVSVGNLSPEECVLLKKVFQKISSRNEKNPGPSCSYSNFQMHCESHLDDWLARRISDKLATKTGKGNELQVPVLNFLNFMSSAMKGSFEDKFDIIWKLAIEDTNSDERKTIQAGEILQYTRSIAESYLKCTENLVTVKSWGQSNHISPDSISDLAYYLLLDLFHRDVLPKDIITTEVSIRARKDSPAKEFTMEEVLTAFSKSVLFLNLQNSILSHCFDFEKSTYFNVTMIPECVDKAKLAADSTIMDMPRLVFLNSQLAPEFRPCWRFLFSTASHGESFSKFMECVLEKGPTLLIVKDTGGNIFGGFAPHGWKLGPKYFGSEHAFLFHLSPRFVIYPTTGYNKNFQYMNINQKTFPNGLGFGGTLEYFGLWLDAEFGKGKCSPSCTTFVNPQLSKTAEFEIEHLEIWGVGHEPKVDEDDRDARSILDKDPEAKAMLELVNKPAFSDGYREPQDPE